MRRYNLVEFDQDSSLLVEALDYCFDDEVAGGKRCEVQSTGNPAYCQIPLFRAQLSLADIATELGINPGKAAVKEILCLLHDDDMVPGNRANLGDARSHLAAADDSDALNSHPTPNSTVLTCIPACTAIRPGRWRAHVAKSEAM